MNASKEMRADKEIVLAAVQKGEVAFRYASEEMRGDKETVLAAVQKDGSLLAKFFFVQDPDGYEIEVLQRHGRFK